MTLSSVAVFGEILWDLLPTGPVLGGAPFNFAYRMNTLGIKSTLFSQVGDDDLGRKTIKDVQYKNMDIRCIGMSTRYPTGTVNITLDEHQSPDFTILPDVAYDYIPVTSKMESITKKAEHFYFGTVSQRNSTSRMTLMNLLDQFSGKHIFYDINLRKGCYTKDIIRKSLSRCSILKVNEHEVPVVAESLGFNYSTLDDFLDLVMTHSTLDTCVITLGEKGACAVNREGDTGHASAFTVQPVDTCGSGDGFAAGFLYALIQEQTLTEACRFGNALGALVALQKGATGYVSLEDIIRFMEQK